MKSATLIRNAEPTIEEGLKFACFVMDITQGLFRFMLGRDPEKIIAAAYTQEKNDLSYQNTIFAEIDGEVVGMAAGYTAEEHHGFSRNLLIRAAGRRALRARFTFLLLSTMFRALNTHHRDDYYLHYIGVDKEYRGRGIGASLMTDIEARAIATGSHRLTLDVEAHNRGAITLYEKSGMSIVSKWPRLPMIPPIIYRMAKPLEG